jgi:hypothetical protein
MAVPLVRTVVIARRLRKGFEAERLEDFLAFVNSLRITHLII